MAGRHNTDPNGSFNFENWTNQITRFRGVPDVVTLSIAGAQKVAAAMVELAEVAAASPPIHASAAADLSTPAQEASRSVGAVGRFRQDPDRLEDDLEIEEQTPVLDVVTVELHPLLIGRVIPS